MCGQYYKPAILSKKFNKKNIKMNEVVVASLYSHDYNNGLKLLEHSYIGNNFVKAAIQLIAKYKGYPFVWCGDYADENIEVEGDKFNAYELSQNKIKPNELDDIVSAEGIAEDYKYIVNYTKREYIEIPKYRPKSWDIHPLPLLCCDGNGKGSGDYRGINMNKVGIWAYDRIGVTNKRPHYKKINVTFEERD